MTVGALLFFVVLLGTIFAGEKGQGPKDIPFGSTLRPPATSGWELRLDRLGLWVVVAIILVAIAYAPFAISYLPPHLVSQGFRLF